MDDVLDLLSNHALLIPQISSFGQFLQFLQVLLVNTIFFLQTEFLNLFALSTVHTGLLKLNFAWLLNLLRGWVVEGCHALDVEASGLGLFGGAGFLPPQVVEIVLLLRLKDLFDVLSVEEDLDFFFALAERAILLLTRIVWRFLRTLFFCRCLRLLILFGLLRIWVILTAKTVLIFGLLLIIFLLFTLDLRHNRVFIFIFESFTECLVR